MVPAGMNKTSPVLRTPAACYLASTVSSNMACFAAVATSCLPIHHSSFDGVIVFAVDQLNVNAKAYTTQQLLRSVPSHTQAAYIRYFENDCQVYVSTVLIQKTDAILRKEVSCVCHHRECNGLRAAITRQP